MRVAVTTPHREASGLRAAPPPEQENRQSVEGLHLQPSGPDLCQRSRGGAVGSGRRVRHGKPAVGFRAIINSWPGPIGSGWCPMLKRDHAPASQRWETPFGCRKAWCATVTRPLSARPWPPSLVGTTSRTIILQSRSRRIMKRRRSRPRSTGAIRDDRSTTSQSPGVNLAGSGPPPCRPSARPPLPCRTARRSASANLSTIWVTIALCNRIAAVKSFFNRGRWPRTRACRPAMRSWARSREPSAAMIAAKW